MSKSRITIIGAGPIGLETALYATELGFEVTLLEQHNVVAGNILNWGHVRLFSPFEMNHSPLGTKRLKTYDPGWSQPDERAFMTGTEYVTSYLLPLSNLPQLRDTIHTGVKVVSISREDVLKGEFIGVPQRAARPFRILTEDAEGREQIYHSDIVIDTTGVYGNPNWLGSGGIPAIGERACRKLIHYELKDVYGKERAAFAGKQTLLVGSGYSAATAVIDFENLIREEPQTSLVWIVRGDTMTPIPVIDNDTLSGRARLTERANLLAQGNTPGIAFKNQTAIDSIHYSETDKQFTVVLKRGNATETIRVDNILANVGFGPDNSIYRELQVHECYASRGPMKLAATLLANTSGDCLTQQSAGAETLKNPEPGFFIIGSKSYGRNSTFLIRTGLSQVVEVFTLLTGDRELNLYRNATTKEPIS